MPSSFNYSPCKAGPVTRARRERGHRRPVRARNSLLSCLRTALHFVHATRAVVTSAQARILAPHPPSKSRSLTVQTLLAFGVSRSISFPRLELDLNAFFGMLCLVGLLFVSPYSSGSSDGHGFSKQFFYYQFTKDGLSYDVRVEISSTDGWTDKLEVFARLKGAATKRWISAGLAQMRTRVENIQMPVSMPKSTVRQPEEDLGKPQSFPVQNSEIFGNNLERAGLLTFRLQPGHLYFVNVPLAVGYGHFIDEHISEPPVRPDADRRIFVSGLGSHGHLSKTFGNQKLTGAVILSIVDFMPDGRAFTNGTGFVFERFYYPISQNADWLLSPEKSWVLSYGPDKSVHLNFGHERQVVRGNKARTYVADFTMSKTAADKLSYITAINMPPTRGQPIAPDMASYLRAYDVGKMLTKFGFENRIEFELQSIKLKMQSAESISWDEVKSITAFLNSIDENGELQSEVLRQKERSVETLGQLLKYPGFAKVNQARIFQALRRFLDTKRNGENKFLASIPTTTGRLISDVRDALRGVRFAPTISCELIFQPTNSPF